MTTVTKFEIIHMLARFGNITFDEACVLFEEFFIDMQHAAHHIHLPMETVE